MVSSDKVYHRSTSPYTTDRLVCSNKDVINFVGHGRRLNEQRTPFCVLRHNSNSHISSTMFSDIALSETLGCISWILFFLQKIFFGSLETEMFQLTAIVIVLSDITI